MPEVHIPETLGTAPFDPRFPNQNQTRYCYQSYLDYHRCQKLRGEKYEPCNYFRKVFNSICPNSWVERWDGQRAEEKPFLVTRIQQYVAVRMSKSESMGRGEVPCRTCTDFKNWSKNNPFLMQKNKAEEKIEQHREDCPLDKNELGRSTWGFLHTMAAYYPDSPNQEQMTNMRSFFTHLSNFYPCEYCAKDLRDELKVDPPQAKSQHELTQWLCRLHNKVNVKLGKKEFDCTKINERWRDGWLDGSCD